MDPSSFAYVRALRQQILDYQRASRRSFPMVVAANKFDRLPHDEQAAFHDGAHHHKKQFKIAPRKLAITNSLGLVFGSTETQLDTAYDQFN